MIFAANFKSNHTRKTTKEYMQKLNAYKTEHTVWVFPPATALDEFKGSVRVGVQNAFATHNGAYTGELGLEQLDEFNIKTILIGHSERRLIIGETLGWLQEKFNFYQEQNFNIVFCIGEPLEIREEGVEALKRYLDEQLEGIDLSYKNLTIAYEPIWAIGTGKTASIEEIELTHNYLKTKFNSPLLYGGSVKVDNIKDIAKIKSVDGVLVGSASLDVDNFIQMIEKLK